MAYSHYKLPAQGRIDPITVIVDDIEPGKGVLVVVVFGAAWSCYWGAMGGRDLMDFLGGVDAGYVANNLISSRRQWITNRKQEDREMEYLVRVAEVVCAFAASRRVKAPTS